MSYGVIVLKNELKNIPQSPGIYKMLDKQGKILYIGKAKNLASRIANYTGKDLGSRTLLMVSQIYEVEIIQTATEEAALLLEATLIRSLQPKYNILLKDDKSFPYILIRQDHDFPQIMKYRGSKKTKGKYFGPYASLQKVKDSVNTLQEIFKLRPCSDGFFSTRKKPCMYYQINKCSAPCVGKISKEDYAEQVKEAINFLKGNNKLLQNDLMHKMNEASIQFEYEKAAKYRDRVRAMSYVLNQQNFDVGTVDTDIIAIVKQGDIACINSFIFRDGQNFGNHLIYPERVFELSEAQILSNFMAAHYQIIENLPKRIITNVSPEYADELENIFKFKIYLPMAPHKVLEVSLFNANEALLRKNSSQLFIKNNLEKMQHYFHLACVPEKVEIYDNSHIMGEDSIGAMVTYTKNGFDKKSYRQFAIKSTKVGDDYQMLKEVMQRRFAHKEWPTPDFMVIDGGLGQMYTVLAVLKELDLDIKFVCISKGPERKLGEERLCMVGRNPYFNLERNDPLLYFLQTLRDEAHRFAITSHRNKRDKKLTLSELDAIPNIGPKRKKILLTHFGSVAAIKEATIEDLQRVANINEVIARGIYRFFHGE